MFPVATFPALDRPAITNNSEMMVCSRAFAITIGGKPTRAMVPFADMLNHVSSVFSRALLAASLLPYPS